MLASTLCSLQMWKKMRHGTTFTVTLHLCIVLHNACRYPVFFSDVEEEEAWNHPFNMTAPSFCPPGLCYNATSREK
eukprot:1139900-Pelagomonas_calceolata.AAC.8